jgi:hypothetical protein
MKYGIHLVRRAMELLRHEGPVGCLRGAGRFLRWTLRDVVHSGEYYIYRYPIPVVQSEVNRPQVEGFEVRIVRSADDLAALRQDGYEHPGGKVRAMPRRLRSGAVAVCGFVSRRLAYVGWVATSAEAKRSFDRLPYRVDFADGEAATGGAWTVPAYRGLGLYRYMFGQELDYLRREGRTVCCNAIGVANRASQRGQAIYGAQVCARVRVRRLAGFTRWDEEPMSGPCPSLNNSDSASRWPPAP